MAIKVNADTSRTTAALKKLGSRLADEAQKTALTQSALVVERAAKLQLTKSGRHAPGTPTPSAPGSPPAIITGTLRASVRAFPPDRDGFGNYRAMIGPTVVYGRIQELGGGNLPARPYMQPAMRESVDEVRSTYVEVLGRYLRG